MDSLTLDQLRVFVTVAQEGSFSAAARRLHRAQSAISYAVANLEKLLDLSLFDRAGQRPSLTPAGASLMTDAREIMAQVDHLRARSRLMAEGTEPQVSLVVDVMFPMPVLLEVLDRFRREHPTVPLVLHSEALGAVAQLIDAGTCQLGISGPLQEFPPGLERQPLGTVSIISVVAPSHDLAEHNSAPIPTAQLRGHTQLVLTDRSQLTEGIDLGVLSARTWRMADLGTKHECLRAGFGWGNMPRHLVEQDLERGALVQIHPAEWQQELVVPQFIIHRASDPPGPAGQWLVDRLRERCPSPL